MKGTGYDPTANVGGRGAPIPANLPQGTYVVFGNFAENWKPSAGAAAATRSGSVQAWALAESVLDQVPSQYQAAVRGQWAPLAADGSFTATLTLKDTTATPGSYGVYTYGAGGVSNADQERSVALNYAPAPKVAVSDLAVSDAGITANVTGTLFGAATGVYAAIIETGTEANVTAGGGFAAMQFVRNVSGGAFSVALAAPASALDRTKTYEVIVWTQHTLPNAQTMLARTPVTISTAQWDIVKPVPAAPSISVFLADGVTPVEGAALKTGDKVVVKGSGYSPTANVGGRGVPIPANLPQGTYVVFGNFAENWKPSASAPSANRSIGSQLWALSETVLDQVPEAFQPTIRSQWVDIAADGTFTATLTLKDSAAKPGAYGVYTYAAGGVVNAEQERSVALNYNEAPVATATVKAATEDGLTVTAGGSQLGSITGAYVALIEAGTEADVTAGGGFAAMQFVRNVSGGAFTVDLVAAKAGLDRSKSYEVIVWQQHTLPTASTIYARQAVNVTDAQWNTVFPPSAPTVSGSVSVASTEGLTVAASGSNLGSITGAYVALIEAGTEADVTAGGGFAAMQFVRNVSGGAFSVDLVAAKAGLDRSKSYEVIVWQQHTLPTASTIYARQAVNVTSAQWDAVFGPLDGPKVTTAVKSATAQNGLTVTATGSKHGSITGAYVALIEKGTEADVTAEGGFVAMQFVRSVSGGGYSVDLTAAASALDRTKTYEVISWQQHTMPTASTIDARSTVPVTEAQWDKIFGPKPPQPPKPPKPPVTPTAPVATVPGGSLRWDVSSSFLSYITGNIAKGAIEVTGGATRADGLFQFGQATGSTYDPATGLGTVSYVGAVRFTGHGGILDVTVANP
ncbi:MAG: HtaA domain-containing protein, partial [Microbacterium sp.]|nr:HtaA domain-containing protein [Microbacterium sp.]